MAATSQSRYSSISCHVSGIGCSHESAWLELTTHYLGTSICVGAIEINLPAGTGPTDLLSIEMWEMGLSQLLASHCLVQL